MATHGARRSAPRARRPGPLTFDPDDAIVRLRWHVYLLAVMQIVQGAGYLFGAPATAPSLLLMRDFMPMAIWSGLLVAGGLLMLFGRLVSGNAICALVCLVWAVFAFAVLPLGTATGWGWPWPAGLAVIHGFALSRSARAVRDRHAARRSAGR